MPSTVILGTARTPFGKMGGALSSLDATELGGRAIEAALERAEVEPEQVQQVVFGQVLQAGQGQIPSRQAQIKAGIPKEVPSETINKVCASGMRAIGLADQAVRAGDVEIAVTGGMESMSQAPYLLPGARFGFRMGDVQAIDAMTHDGLTNPFTDKQMINEASEVSNELEITRADMDRFAARSHQLAAKATDEGRLAEEIVAVTVKSRKAETEVEADEAIRPDTTIETLAKLKAIGGDDATHTAGNAPGVNDGAGAVIVASEEWASENGRRPIAKVLSYGAVADDFPYLAKTPARRRQAGAGEDRQAAPRTSTSGRSTRPSRRWRSTRCGCSGSRRRTSTSTAARSRSATRSAPPAPGSSARSSTSCAAAAAASAAPRSARAAARATRSCSRSTAGNASMASQGAAFFDLDKTLMAGSSGMPFARVAARQGIVSRRQLARWGIDHLRYRLRGATDEETADVLKVARELITGVAGRDIDRMGPEVMAAILPRIYPADAGGDLAPPGRRAADLHRQRRRQRHRLSRWRRCCRWRAGSAPATRSAPTAASPAASTARSSTARARSRRCERFAAEHGIDLAASYAYSDSSLGPADAARGRPPGRRQPRPGAGRDRPRGGLAGDALRAPRPPPRDRRRAAFAATLGWGSRALAARRKPPPRASAAAALSAAVKPRASGSDLCPLAPHRDAYGTQFAMPKVPGRLLDCAHGDRA